MHLRPHALPAALAGVLLSLLVACGGAAGPGAVAPALPGREHLTPGPGCTVVSVSPATALAPSIGDGREGQAGALIRYQADCLPDIDLAGVAPRPYRVAYEQTFTRSRVYPGGVPVWVGGEVRPVDESAGPGRKVDAGGEGMGVHCAALLERLDSHVARCLLARDEGTGRQFRQALEGFRAQQRFQYNVMGDNHLAVIRLGRDTACLTHWQQVQAHLDDRFAACTLR